MAGKLQRFSRSSRGGYGSISVTQKGSTLDIHVHFSEKLNIKPGQFRWESRIGDILLDGLDDMENAFTNSLEIADTY